MSLPLMVGNFDLADVILRSCSPLFLYLLAVQKGKPGGKGSYWIHYWHYRLNVCQNGFSLLMTFTWRKSEVTCFWLLLFLALFSWNFNGLFVSSARKLLIFSSNIIWYIRSVIIFCNNVFMYNSLRFCRITVIPRLTSGLANEFFG